MRFLVAMLLFLVSGFSPAPALAGPGAWTTGGPSERILAVAAQPSDANVLLAAGTSGVWQSVDGGASWSLRATTSLGQSLAYDPLNPSIVYANSADTKQVLQSTDGGATWTSVFTLTGPAQILSVLPDPHAANRVFASGSGSDGLAAVFRSVDAGGTWTNVLPASLNGAGGLSVPVATPLGASPIATGLVMSGVTYYHSGGVVGSTDGGATWNLVYNGGLTPLAGASSLATGPSIYAGMNVLEFGGLVRSDDAGATWADLTSGLPISGPSGGFVQAIAVDVSDPAAVYIAEWDTATPPRTGVFASNDRGATWTELGHLASRVSSANGLVLAVGSQTLYAATESGVYQFTLGARPTKESVH